MKISTDINCFYGKYSIEETIDIIANAGFEAIDFTFMDEKYYNGEVSEAECQRHYVELKKYAEDKGICISQAHAPCPSSVDDEKETERLFQNIVRSMRNASYMGAEIIVVHGKDHIEYNSRGGAERLFELNMEFYNRLKPYCEEYGVKVALENLPQIHKFSDVQSFLGCHKVVKSVCATPEEFNHYLDNLDKNWFVACLDIGHAMITGQSPEEMIYALGGERLKVLHIHDNNGQRDLHTIPYLGGMAEWNSIMRALKGINYGGSLNFEAGNFCNQFPKELYSDAVKMMAAVGRQLVGMME